MPLFFFVTFSFISVLLLGHFSIFLCILLLCIHCPLVFFFLQVFLCWCRRHFCFFFFSSFSSSSSFSIFFSLSFFFSQRFLCSSCCHYDRRCPSLFGPFWPSFSSSVQLVWLLWPLSGYSDHSSAAPAVFLPFRPLSSHSGSGHSSAVFVSGCLHLRCHFDRHCLFGRHHCSFFRTLLHPAILWPLWAAPTTLVAPVVIRSF